MDRSITIAKRISEGLSKRAIAKLEDISPNSVAYWTKKLGLKGNFDPDETGHKPAKRSDVVGKTFGYLLIKKLVIEGTRGYHAVCKCLLCNNDTTKNLGNILRGTITSCGCRRDQYKKITGKNSSQYKGYNELSGALWNKIVKRAEEKGHPVEFDIKFAWDLFEKQNKKCALTGLRLKFGRSQYSSETTASLDRINSDLGYTKDNVQWVYKDINIMKNMFDQDYFIKLCNLVSDNHRSDADDPQSALFNRGRYRTN